LTAYLGTAEARTFIVPTTPPADMAVAANYERFDGLEPLDNRPGLVPFGAPYAPAPRDPGQTPVAGQGYTRGPVPGLTNTLGGQPLPVAHWADGHPRGYTPAPARLIGGPKTGRQNYQGAAETVFFADLQSNPPQPGDLASIIAGLS
jgi:hypothetical protein